MLAGYLKASLANLQSDLYGMPAADGVMDCLSAANREAGYFALIWKSTFRSLFN